MSYKRYKIGSVIKSKQPGGGYVVYYPIQKNIDEEPVLYSAQLVISEENFKKAESFNYIVMDEKNNLPIAIDNKLIFTDQYKKLSFWKRLKIYLRALLYILSLSDKDSL